MKIQKTILFWTIALVLLASVFALSNEPFQYRYNPYTYKLDLFHGANFSGSNVTADYFFGNGTFLTEVLNKITSLSRYLIVTDTDGVVTIDYNETASNETYVNADGDSMTGNLNMTEHNITNVDALLASTVTATDGIFGDVEVGDNLQVDTINVTKEALIFDKLTLYNSAFATTSVFKQNSQQLLINVSGGALDQFRVEADDFKFYNHAGNGLFETALVFTDEAKLYTTTTGFRMVSDLFFGQGATPVMTMDSTTGEIQTDSNITANRFIGELDSSNITNEYWVDESGDTMSGNLVMDYDANITFTNSTSAEVGQIGRNESCIILTGLTSTINIC